MGGAPNPWLTKALALARRPVADSAIRAKSIGIGEPAGANGANGTNGVTAAQIIARPHATPPGLVIGGRVRRQAKVGPGRATPEARELVSEARRVGCELVVDGELLRVWTPAYAGSDLVAQLFAVGAAVGHVLREASDQRIAMAMAPTSSGEPAKEER